MAAIDYNEIALIAQELCTEAGRAVTLYQLSSTVANPAQPNRGPGVATRINPVPTVGVFVVPNTSIPTESRGLAFDWVDQELLKRARHVFVVPALGLPDLEQYKELVDSSRSWKILWGQCLQPGDVRLLYVFGVAE